jgi:hypothetical protein
MVPTACNLVFQNNDSKQMCLTGSRYHMPTKFKLNMKSKKMIDSPQQSNRQIPILNSVPEGNNFLR